MKKTSGKYKRGDRGSLQEKDNVSKQCNMAGSVGEVLTVEVTQLEPNLIDIKEMLVIYRLYSRKTKN